MASARDIKRRIKSIKSTQQITKAMKMVSAGKLRKSQAAVTAVRPFTAKMDQLILHVSEAVEHPYLQPRPEVKKVCYVVLGSDRGLCGGFNGNLNRFLGEVLAEETRPYALIVVGRKVREYCLRNQFTLTDDLVDMGDNPRFSQAQALGRKLRKAYEDGEYDEIRLVYSKFRSTVSQVPMQQKLLPVPKPEVDEEDSKIFASIDYIFEPSAEEILEKLMPQYVDIAMFCAMQEAKASEHSARMMAMSSATDNATDMISNLTLSLNRARQAAITTEITEIIGGASALSS